MITPANSTSPNRSARPRGPRHIRIVGVPVDIGASQPGAIMGPAALRTAGIVESLRELGHEVVDQGDLPAPPPVPLPLPHTPTKARNLGQIAAWLHRNDDHLGLEIAITFSRNAQPGLAL